MKRKLGIVILFVVVMASAAFYFGSSAISARKVKAPIVRWNLLKQLDYETGESTAQLSALNGQMVRLPGFVVPLEDDYQTASEFLLVPEEGSCIHVPPPPPNQMVYVKMQSGHSVRIAGVPYWITGRLKIENVPSPYGKVSFTLEGLSARGFTSWNDPGDEGE